MVQNNQENQKNEKVNNSVNNGYRDYLTGYNDYEEETATEISAPVQLQRERTNHNQKTESGKGFGYIALALAIISLFTSPILFGAAGIILGFIARSRGATGLGNWAIGIGALSVIIGLFLAPFF